MHPLPCRYEVFSPNCVGRPSLRARRYVLSSRSGTLYVGITGFFDAVRGQSLTTPARENRVQFHDMLYKMYRDILYTPARD